MGNAVLIVDGCDGYRDYLVSFFQDREFSVTGSASYPEASALIAKKKFDVVIVDYFIGAENAEAFCAALAGQGQDDTVLIIMSTLQSTEIELDIRKHSPAFFFVKPILIDNLYAVVLKIFESRNKKSLLRKKTLSPC